MMKEEKLTLKSKSIFVGDVLDQYIDTVLKWQKGYVHHEFPKGSN